MFRTAVPCAAGGLAFFIPSLGAFAGGISVGSGPDVVQVLFNWPDGFVADYNVGFTPGVSGTIDGYDATQGAAADPNLTLNWTNFRTVANPNYFLNVASYTGGHIGNGATYNINTAPNNFWHEWFNNGSGWIFGHGASVDMLSNGGAIGWVFGSNATPVLEPTLTWDNGGGGGDGVSWDTISQNWNNGSGVTTYGDGSDVIFNDSNAGNYAVALNVVVRPESVLVDNGNGNYTISGSGGIAGAGALAKMGGDVLTLSTVNSYLGGTTVSAGTLVIGVNGALPDHGLTISGGTARLAINTGVAQATSLSISGNGVLDIANNHLIISYAAGMQSAVDGQVRQYLVNGYDAGAWNGAGGIDSSTAGLPGNTHYGIGYADGADDIAVGISSGQIEVKYTLYGDTDLDGSVTGTDFTNLVSNLGKSGRVWDQGDFDYDGSVTGIDFTLMVSNLGRSASGADVAIPAGDYAAIDAFAAANGLLADVPEPTGAVMMLMGVVGVLCRRRRVGCGDFPELSGS
jgi:autotransporter-associated beta strand protein